MGEGVGGGGVWRESEFLPPMSTGPGRRFMTERSRLASGARRSSREALLWKGRYWARLLLLPLPLQTDFINRLLGAVLSR